MKRTVIAALAAMAVLALAGCGEGTTAEPATDNSAPATTKPMPEPSTPPLPVTDDSDDEPALLSTGDGAEILDGGEASGTITITELQITTKPFDVDYGSKPKNGYFLIFTVRMDAVGPFDAYDGDFYVITDTGQHVDGTDGNAWDAVDYDATLGFVELNTGEHKIAVLPFDSPSKHGQLAYAPNYEGGPIVSWKF